MKRQKNLKILSVSVLAAVLLIAFTITAFAASQYVCTECGANLTYTKNGEDFTITHPSGGTCSHAGKSLQNDLSWAKVKTSGDSGSSGSGSDSENTEVDYGIAGLMLDTIFGTSSSESDSLLGDIFNPMKLLSEAVDLVDDVCFEGDGLTGDAFYYAFQAISITIAIFYFMSGMVSKDLSRNFGKPTMEMVAKPFGRLIVVIVFIMCSGQICRFFLWLSQVPLGQMVSISEGSTTLGNSTGVDLTASVMQSCGFQDLSTAGTLDKLFGSISNFGVTLEVMVAFLIPFVISMVCNVAAVWVIMTRTVNLALMTVLAPLAMSDLYGDHPFKDTRAFGWFRKYFGLCIQSSVIVLAYYVTGKVCGSLMDSVFAALSGADSLAIGTVMNLGLYIAVLKIVQIGVVAGSAHKAQEIVGG